MTRTVVVTGGGTGIGRAIASAFVARGDHVVIVGRRTEVLERAADEMARRRRGTVFWQACDVSDAAAVAEFRAWLIGAAGLTVDVLVNNAGSAASLADKASLQEAYAHAHAVLDGNLVGAYLMVHALRPHLRRPGARVINVSSVAAFRGGGDMYSAAKAAVVGLTYALALDLGADGITVNAVAPGLTLGTEFFGDRITDDRRDRTVAQIPLGRPGTPADVAGAVDFLASAQASYITGQVLHVNGGWVFGR